jgi:hypothetical protein
MKIRGYTLVNCQCGINLYNADDSIISENQISNPNPGSSNAILLRAHAVSSVPVVMSNIEISENDISNILDTAIYVLAQADQDVSHIAIVDNVAIVDNDITGDKTAIMLWRYGIGTAIVKDVNITGNSISINNPTSDFAALTLYDVGGASTLSNNSIKITGGNMPGVWIAGAPTGDWTVANNYFDGGNNESRGIDAWVLPETSNLNISENVVTGWKLGIAYWGYASIEVKSNLIYGNQVGLQSDIVIDATLNYWGHESGPYHESSNPLGQGNSVSNNVVFDPWYIDIECTISSDQKAMDQEYVNTAIAKVPATIASVEVPGGTGASDEAKRAAVKAYIENLEGMAALGVTITIDAGSSSGYKVSITKGDAIGIRDNVEVIKFTIPLADSEAAGIVNDLITALPSAANLYLDNYLTHLAAIEEAEAAFNALTEPQKAILGALTVDKLENLVTKAQGLVLEELDSRILSAIDGLHLTGTGIDKVEFENREATLFVDDPNKKVHEFVQSGVVSLFESMFQDVVAMRLGEDPDWYGVEGTSAGAIEAGAHIVSVLLGFPYEYGEDFGGVFSQLAAADLGDLLDKSLSIEVKIQRLEDGKEYLGTYIIGFSPANEEVAKAVAKTEEETFTLTFDGNGGTPELIEVQVETEVMLEALPAVSREGYTFIEWNTCADGSGEAFDLKTAITEDMTLYAVWKEAETEKPGLEEPIEEPEGESEEPEDEESPVELEEPEEEIEDEEDDNETGDPDEPEGGETPAEPEDPADEPEETPTGPEEDDDDDYEETDPDAIVDEEEDAEDDEERDGNTESGEGNSGEEQNADGENGVEEDGVA